MAARRLNAVAISLSLSRVYARAQSAQWHFPGLGVCRQLDAEVEVTVNGKVHNVPGANSNGGS